LQPGTLTTRPERQPQPYNKERNFFINSCTFEEQEEIPYVRRLLVAACVVPSSPIFVTLMKEARGSSEMSVLTRATRRNNPEDTILHSHRRENLKSCTFVPNMEIEISHYFKLLYIEFRTETAFCFEFSNFSLSLLQFVQITG
jgi:hypothetical protein